VCPENEQEVPPGASGHERRSASRSSRRKWDGDIWEPAKQNKTKQKPFHLF